MAKRPPKPSGRPASPRHKERKSATTASETPKAAQKRKPTLRDRSRQWPTHEEQEAALSAITNASADPVVVSILGAAIVEYELERMLRPRFAHRDEDTWNNLTGDNGPIGTFSQKITMGYAVGLYPPLIRSALDKIRQIRNAFAHNKSILTFDDPLVKGALKSVQIPAGKRHKQYKYLSMVRDAADHNPKSSYVLLCYTILLHFGDRRIEAMKSSNRRARAKFRRQQEQAPYFGALAAGFIPSQKGSPTNWLRWLQDRQSGDPTPGVPLGTPTTLPETANADDDNEGK